MLQAAGREMCVMEMFLSAMTFEEISTQKVLVASILIKYWP